MSNLHLFKCAALKENEYGFVATTHGSITYAHPLISMSSEASQIAKHVLRQLSVIILLSKIRYAYQNGNRHRNTGFTHWLRNVIQILRLKVAVSAGRRPLQALFPDSCTVYRRKGDQYQKVITLEHRLNTGSCNFSACNGESARLQCCSEEISIAPTTCTMESCEHTDSIPTSWKSSPEIGVVSDGNNAWQRHITPRKSSHEAASFANISCSRVTTHAPTQHAHSAVDFRSSGENADVAIGAVRTAVCDRNDTALMSPGSSATSTLLDATDLTSTPAKTEFSSVGGFLSPSSIAKAKSALRAAMLTRSSTPRVPKRVSFAPQTENSSLQQITPVIDHGDNTVADCGGSSDVMLLGVYDVDTSSATTPTDQDASHTQIAAPDYHSSQQQITECSTLLTDNGLPANSGVLPPDTRSATPTMQPSIATPTSASSTGSWYLEQDTSTNSGLRRVSLLESNALPMSVTCRRPLRGRNSRLFQPRGSITQPLRFSIAQSSLASSDDAIIVSDVGALQSSGSGV